MLLLFPFYHYLCKKIYIVNPRKQIKVLNFLNF